jgi:hypothetical protein
LPAIVRISIAFIVVALLIGTPVVAQTPREKVDLEMIGKIKEEGLKHSQIMETISYLTDVNGPRLTNSPQIRRAAEWTQGRLREWSLQNTHTEVWGPFGRGWSLEGFTANIVQPSFSSLVAYPKAWSPSTPKTVRGEPVFLDAKTENDLDKYRGKLHHAIVLFSGAREVKPAFDPLARRQTDAALLALANGDGTTPRSSSRSTTANLSEAGPSSTFNSTPEQRASLQFQARKWQLIYDEGAAIVLEPASRGDGGTVFVSAAYYPTRATEATNGQPAASGQPRASSGDSSPVRRPRPWQMDAPEMIPQIVVNVEHYNRLVRMVEKGTHVELELDIASKYHTEDLKSFNIVAEIPGTDLKDELVMLGGHFDSWHSGTGATDNAVGCGVALEAVRILQAIGVKPRRTIRLALWTGEEQGLLGSKAYVIDHFGNANPWPSSGTPSSRSGDAPPTKYELKPDHAKFSAYFNLDNGTGKIRGVYLQRNEAVRAIFRSWLAPFADMGASTIALSNTSGTDHLSFDAVGLPGFQFIQDPLEYDSRTHHSSMDVYERIVEDDVKQASVIMASFVYHAAMRDEKLPRKPLVGEVAGAAVQQ